MQSYKLDEDTQESFPFEVGGHAYKMRYPTTEEVFEQRENAETQKDLPIRDQLKWVYGFVSSDDPAAPPIETVISRLSVKVLQNFNAMIKAEFSSSEN